MVLRFSCLLLVSLALLQTSLGKKNGKDDKQKGSSGEVPSVDDEIAKAVQDGVSINLIVRHFTGIAMDSDGVLLSESALETKIQELINDGSKEIGPIDKSKVYRLPQYMDDKHDAAVEERNNPGDPNDMEIPEGAPGNRNGEAVDDLTADLQKDSSTNPHVDIRGDYSYVPRGIFDTHVAAMQKAQTSSRRRRSDNSANDNSAAKPANGVDATCDQYIDADYAEITSPNYPNAYEPNTDCSYYITVPANKTLTLEFVAFNIEFCPDCSCDALYVKGAPHCGTKAPGQSGIVTYFTDGIHQVRFVTDGNTELTGFSLIARRQPAEVIPQPHLCTFDTDMCGYLNDQNDQLDWARLSGQTPSTGTGPDGDHTTGTGFYIYTESSGFNAGDMARISTPIYSSAGGRGCARFWYHMYGADMGALNVYVNVDARPTSPIFNVSGNFGNQWLSAEVDYAATGRHSLMFESVRGAGFEADLAIDDVEVSDQPCNPPPPTTPAPTTVGQLTTRVPCDPATQFECNDGACIPKDWVCDDIVDCSAGEDEINCPTASPTQAPPVTIECNGNLTDDFGYIQSPNWPNNYPNNADCTYVIHIPDGHYAHVLFQEVDIETCGVGQCVCDALIMNGNRFCGVTFFTSGYLLPNNDGQSIIRFVSDYSVTHKGFLAAVTIYPGIPAVDLPNTCTFEALNTCGYSQSENDVFDWMKGSSRTPSANTGPDYDHTYGDLTGNYMFIETSFPRVFGDRARIQTPVFIAPHGMVCAGFWYHMYGAHVNTLAVSHVKVSGSTPNDTSSTQIWVSQFNQGNVWQYAEVEFYADTYFQVAFDGICGGGYQGDLAIDDVTISNGNCQTLGTGVPSTVTPQPIDECNRQIYDNYTQFNSPNYPNPYDNDLSCNYTFYVPANKYAAIYYDDFEVEQCGASCSCDALIVEGTRFCGNTRPGANGTMYFPLDPVINIQFETDYSVTYRGFHAYAVIYDKIGYTLPFDCYFEVGDHCGFIQYLRDDFDWSRGTGSTPSSGTGPSFDHTTGSGHYFYIESSSPRTLGDHARLFSPVFYPPGEVCLSFWYHMYGTAMGTLEVILLYENSTTFSAPIFQMTGNQGDVWMNAEFTLYSDEFFRFIFDAYVGSSFTSDMAIDDITLKDGPCVNPTIPTTCSPNQFRCADGSCIPDYWECDGIIDCPDSDDETNCSFATCTPGYFQCDNGWCIPNNWICDGIQDCIGNEDEACSTTAKP